MAKLALNDLASLANQTTAINTINANHTLLETALENTLSRDGTSPNSMSATLDMNSNRILNLPEPIGDTEPVRLQDMAGTITVINGLSAFGVTLLDDANAAAARTTLGLGTSATVNTGTSGATIPLLDGTNTASGVNTFSNATDATSTSTGAIVTSGGIGAAKQIRTATSINAGTSITAGTSLVAGTSVTAGTNVTVGAGTTTVAPVNLTSGTNLTSPVAGAVEYDGKAKYFTPNTSNRGVMPAIHVTIPSAGLTGTDVNTAQSLFPTLGTITLPASTAYEFEGNVVITRAAGTTSHTTSLLFGGTATLTSIMYQAIVKTSTGAALTAGSMHHATSAAAIVVTAASTSATENVNIWIKGIVRINAAGTFIPQFQYSAAPGGVPTIIANSYFKLNPIGSNTVESVGNWST